MNCAYCRKDAIYRCGTCGQLACEDHIRSRTVCLSCIRKISLEYTIEEVTLDKERKKIREFVKRFWGEQEQMTFDRKFVVGDLPAYVAKAGGSIVGFISFAETNDAIILVALGILPKYQNSGIGRRLIEKVHAEAKRLGKKKLLVSTSNDDLPALAFYQFLGFQIYEVKPDVIAEKHGGILKGVGGLPVRDELRLHKEISHRSRGNIAGTKMQTRTNSSM